MTQRKQPYEARKCPGLTWNFDNGKEPSYGSMARKFLTMARMMTRRYQERGRHRPLVRCHGPGRSMELGEDQGSLEVLSGCLERFLRVSCMFLRFSLWRIPRKASNPWFVSKARLRLMPTHYCKQANHNKQQSQQTTVNYCVFLVPHLPP